MPLLPFSFALMPHDDIPPEELDAAADELGVKRSTQERIAVLTQRLEYLRREQDKLAKATSTPETVDAISEELFRIRKEIAQTEQLLSSYKSQHDGRN